MNGWMVLTGSPTNRPGATTSESLAAKSVGWDTLQFLNSSWTDKPNNCFIVINSPMGAPLTQTPHHARHGEGPLQVHHMESGFCECWIDPGQATLAISINKMHNSSTKGMYFKLFYHVFSNHDDFQTSPKVRPPPAVANGLFPHELLRDQHGWDQHDASAAPRWASHSTYGHWLPKKQHTTHDSLSALTRSVINP